MSGCLQCSEFRLLFATLYTGIIFNTRKTAVCNAGICVLSSSDCLRVGLALSFAWPLCVWGSYYRSRASLATPICYICHPRGRAFVRQSLPPGHSARWVCRSACHSTTRAGTPVGRSCPHSRGHIYNRHHSLIYP